MANENGAACNTNSIRITPSRRIPPWSSKLPSHGGRRVYLSGFAKSVIVSQLLYASPILVRSVIPHHKRTFTQQHRFPFDLNYPFVNGLTATPNLPSSHNQPRLTIPDPESATLNNLKGIRNKSIITRVEGTENELSDGQIRSLPCSKNGPYTCSKCREVCLTAQHFASHVSSVHYKFETKEQRRKRRMGKMRRRNLRIQRAKDGALTIAPVLHQWEGAIPVPGGSNAATAKLAVNGGDKRGGPSASCSSRVKEEQMGVNECVVPPGFEGHACMTMS